LGQTGDWGILSSGILVALVESVNKIAYTNKKKFKILVCSTKNFLSFCYL
jgi:hypothetical protein